MHVAFIGAGGVCGFFGGRLCAAGGEVTFVARGEHGRALRERGLRLLSIGGDLDCRPGVVLEGEPVPAADAFVVAVKAHQLEGALERIAPAVGDGTPVLSLLNGLGHEPALSRHLPRAHVLIGNAFVGSRIEGPGVILHTSEGQIAFGEPAGPPGPEAEALREALARGGFPVKTVANVPAAVWRKLLWNAPFNPLNALAGGGCRDLMDTPGMPELLREIMEEVRAIARAEGVELRDEWVEKSLTADVNFSDYRTSMAVDLDHGRPMEIGPILSRPIALAGRHGLDVPRLRLLEATLRTVEAVRARAAGAQVPGSPK